MTFKRRNAGTWVDATTTRKRRSGGAWVNIDRINKRVTGSWSVVFQSITISNASIAWAAPANTNVGYRLNTSGIAEARQAASYSTIATWLNAYSSSDYEVRATLLSGTSPSGSAVGSWLDLGTSREWSIAAAVGIITSVLLIEIRNATTLTLVDSATIDLESERI